MCVCVCVCVHVCMCVCVCVCIYIVYVLYVKANAPLLSSEVLLKKPKSIREFAAGEQQHFMHALTVCSYML